MAGATLRFPPADETLTQPSVYHIAFKCLRKTFPKNSGYILFHVLQTGSVPGVDRHRIPSLLSGEPGSVSSRTLRDFSTFYSPITTLSPLRRCSTDFDHSQYFIGFSSSFRRARLRRSSIEFDRLLSTFYFLKTTLSPLRRRHGSARSD